MSIYTDLLFLNGHVVRPGDFAAPAPACAPTDVPEAPARPPAIGQGRNDGPATACSACA